MKCRFAALLLLAVPLTTLSQLPAVCSGKLVRHEAFPSTYVSARNVDIWLPEGYDTAKKYAVLYMHDGQMLFDSATTWNKQSWDVDDVISRLLREKKIKELILVGIWNGGASRHADYFPQKAFQLLTQAERDSIYKAGEITGPPYLIIIRYSPTTISVFWWMN